MRLVHQAKLRLRNRFTQAFGWLSGLFNARASDEPRSTAELATERRGPIFWFSLVLALAVSTIVVGPSFRTHPLPEFQPGDIVEQTIRSPYTAEVQPKELPSKSREELHKKIAPVFDYDETTIPLWIQAWTQVIGEIRLQFFSGSKKDIAPDALESRLSDFIQRETGQSVSRSDLQYLIKKRFSKEVEKTFEELTKPLLGRLIAQSDLFPSYYSTGIIVRQINLGLRETLVADVSRIWSLDHARQLVNRSNMEAARTTLTRRLGSMIQYLVVPNLRFNASLTDRRLNIALGEREVPLISLKSGQVIAKVGDRINEDQAELIESVRQLTAPRILGQRLVFFTALLSLFFYLLFRVDLTRKSFVRLPLGKALVFGAVTLITLAGIRLSLPLLHSALTSWGINSGAQYLMPVSAGALVIHLTLGREMALSFMVLLAITAGLMVEGSLAYSLWVFAVTLVSVQSIGACKQRSDLYRSGAFSGLVGAAIVLLFEWNQSFGLQSVQWPNIWFRAGAALGAGMLGSILANTLIPLFESVFGFTTNLKLLELSNFNHPLLHNLMMKAPGTYHHSIMVGSLAEIAADKIKANGLLARVSAYYHDIGKMVNPLYFIENQSPQYNPHDHLSPSISARILFSHVKNGARMGREHNLGGAVNDIIEQHHGTTLTNFFFTKAQQATGENDPPIHESDYRYPGPRPQTREAAIVMIADACEASTRSILDPTPTKIGNMVHNIVQKRFLDHQFNDCDLTLKDLQIIEDSISRTLVSLYHHRIEYPGQKQEIGEQTREMPRKSS